MTSAGADVRLGLRHQWRSTWRTARGFAIGAIVATVVLHAFALLTAALYDRLPDNTLTTAQMLPLAAGLWSALALLPALGGGEADDPMALAAAGAGRSFRFGARLGSALTDAGPGLFIPAIAIVGAVTAGWPGWLAGLALAWNGLACGQLSGASSSLLVRRIGPTATLTVVAVAVLLAATVLSASGFGPGAWWQAAVDQPVYVVVLVGTGVAALVGAWALNRPAELVLRPSRPVRVPRRSFAAVLTAYGLGVSRSVMARSTIVTAVLTPLLVRAGGVEVTMSIAFFVTAAAAAVLGANGFAYDGGAAVWLLGKASRWQLLVARVLVTFGWALVLALVAAASAALAGAVLPIDLLPQLVLTALAAALAGLVPSVRRPTSTDFDSFRAQPAPVASAMGTLARSVALTVAILAVPLPWAVVVVGTYAAVAGLHSRLLLRDPVALAALA